MTVTAKSSPFLAEAKRTWNAKIYKKVLALYNDEGIVAAANYLQQFTTAKIPEATINPPIVRS